MKYRLVIRACGWVVQRNYPKMNTAEPTRWETLATYRWHWLASLHLLWLRERARKKFSATINNKIHEIQVPKNNRRHL